MAIQNFKIKINGGNTVSNLGTTFEMVESYIRHMKLESDVTEELVKKARKIPPGSLEHFINNIQTYIANLMRQDNAKKN